MRLEPKSLQFSLWDHTLAALLKVIRRAEVVQVLENLKGWSWLAVAVAMVPREVVSSDRPRGGAPPQRIDSLSSAMTIQGYVCEPDGRGRANSDRSPTRPHSLAK